MSRITKIEIFVILGLLFASSLYFYPKFAVSKVDRQNAAVRAHCANFTMEVLTHFSQNDENEPDFDFVADNSIETLNKITKNPVNKKKKAFVRDEKCEGCVSVSVNKNEKSITTMGYGASGEFLKKTTIKPPSYVTYDNKEN